MVGFVEGFKEFTGDFLRDNDPRVVVDVCKDVCEEFTNYTLWGKIFRQFNLGISTLTGYVCDLNIHYNLSLNCYQLHRRLGCMETVSYYRQQM